jgi:flagellin
MGFSVNTNVSALNTYRNLNTTQASQSKSLEKLSSGLRINRAADDAAGLAISEGLRSQINGTKQAVRNAQDGISVVQTAEGALTETHSILQRMRTLAVQASNDGGLSDTAKQNIQDEIGELTTELDRIASTTEFNGKKLLDGSYTGTFQVGANTGDANQITVDLSTTALASLGVTGVSGTSGLSANGLGISGIDVTSTTGAASAIDDIDAAIQGVSAARSKLGAIQNRLDHTINNLSVASENLSASESRIRDTDMAQEMVSFTRAQILSQAGTAMLAQANSVPQGVLQLLQ